MRSMFGYQNGGREARWVRQASRRRLRGDMTGAFDCAARAAQRGDRIAQFSVGLDYLSGNGTPADVDSAALWLERAAQGGHADAMAQLAVLAVQGRPSGSLHGSIFGAQGPIRPEV